MNKKTLYIIDFDNTFVRCEVLEEIAKISLQDNPNKKQILKEIISICNLGMEGTIPFGESLTRRLTLLNFSKKDLKKVINVLKNNITPSILKHKDFFMENKDQVYIISGAFKECILPITSLFGITDDHILANTFVYDKNDKIIGIDLQNLLSHKLGKAKTVKNLHLRNGLSPRRCEIVVVGDGYTDYEIKKEDVADTFIAFIENVARKNVISKADYVVKNFGEFIKLQS